MLAAGIAVGNVSGNLVVEGSVFSAGLLMHSRNLGCSLSFVENVNLLFGYVN